MVNYDTLVHYKSALTRLLASRVVVCCVSLFRSVALLRLHILTDTELIRYKVKLVHR